MRHTVTTITHDALEQLYAERDELRALVDEEIGRPSWTLHIPAPTKWISANGRQHHQARARDTKVWREAAALRAIAGKLPMGLTKVAITAVVHRTDSRRADAHNRLPSIKAAIDGLVDAGVMVDDSDTHLKSLTIVAGGKLGTAGHPYGRLVLTVTDLNGRG